MNDKIKLGEKYKVILVLYNSFINSGETEFTLTKLYHECYNAGYSITFSALMRVINELSAAKIVSSQKVKNSRIVSLLEPGKKIGKELLDIKKKIANIKKIENDLE